MFNKIHALASRCSHLFRPKSQTPLLSPHKIWDGPVNIRSEDSFEPAGVAQVLKFLAPPKVNKFIAVFGTPTPVGEALSLSLQSRVDRVVALYWEDPSAIIICSGAAVLGPVCEAEAMARSLQKCKIDPKHIICGLHARTTKQNAQEVFDIFNEMQVQGPSQLTLVVEPYQAIRALRALSCVQRQHECAHYVSVKLAAAERVGVAPDADYRSIPNIPRRVVSYGWTEQLNKFCTAQNRRDLERNLTEKVKMSWGY